MRTHKQIFATRAHHLEKSSITALPRLFATPHTRPPQGSMLPRCLLTRRCSTPMATLIRFVAILLRARILIQNRVCCAITLTRPEKTWLTKVRQHGVLLGLRFPLPTYYLVHCRSDEQSCFLPGRRYAFHDAHKWTVHRARVARLFDDGGHKPCTNPNLNFRTRRFPPYKI